MASLFTRTFCIAREVFLINFIFGLSLLADLVERVLPGVVGVVGVVGGVEGGDLVELPPVIGDTVDIPTVDALIKLGGGGFLFPLAAFSRARRTAICFPAFLLSLSENLHARIASGTVDLGQRNR
jgi:hypothetical protein